MNDFAPRKILHFVEDEFTDDKPLELEYSVLKCKKGPDIDFSVVLYKSFYFKKKTRSNWVIPSSLDEKRRNFAIAFLDELRFRVNLNPASKRALALKVISFISWINSHLPETDFTNKIYIKKSYEEYTKWLFNRIKLKDGADKKLTNNAASHLQKSARIACSLITGESVQVIEFWAVAIRLTDRESFQETLTHEPITDEILFQTYAALCNFIHQAWLLLHKQEAGSITIKGVLTYSATDLYTPKKRSELYNKVVIASVMTFIGASGANLQVATEAKIDKFEFGVTGKNSRMSGLKSRARNKVVHPEFASKYLAIWKKWLDIRNDWLKYKGIESDLAFPYFSMDESINPIPPGSTNSNKTCGKWISAHYGVTWINPRKWRGFKSKLLGKASDNDILASAEMQGHSIKTAIRHYSNRNLSDAAEEIGSALDAIYNSAIARCRNREDIDIKIIESPTPDTMTSIGHCISENELKPEISEGFTPYAPQPNCSIKETCMFCDKYAVHADAQDIRKILSFKFVATELSKSSFQRNLEQKWAPYLHRADEILNKLQEYQPSLKDEIERISKDIEYGELDEFWMDYYETLVELEIIE